MVISRHLFYCFRVKTSLIGTRVPSHKVVCIALRKHQRRRWQRTKKKKNTKWRMLRRTRFPIHYTIQQKWRRVWAFNQQWWGQVQGCRFNVRANARQSNAIFLRTRSSCYKYRFPISFLACLLISLFFSVVLASFLFSYMRFYRILFSCDNDNVLPKEDIESSKHKVVERWMSQESWHIVRRKVVSKRAIANWRKKKREIKWRRKKNDEEKEEFSKEMFCRDVIQVCHCQMDIHLSSF